MSQTNRPQMTNLDAILPAGGRISGEFASEAGAEVKALISLGGQTVLERTIATLRATPGVERIVVIGPREVAEHPASSAADATLPEGDSGPENIFRGLGWLRAHLHGRLPQRVLILTTDLPFLTAQAISGFLAACPEQADLCVPVITRGQFEQRFPGSTNFYVRLHDGVWTIGCAFLVHPAALVLNRGYLDSVFAARKSQLAMARLLGPVFVFRYLMHLLTVEHIEQRCTQLLGCRGAAVRGCSPELAYDIDEPAHYRYAVNAKGKR